MSNETSVENMNEDNSGVEDYPWNESHLNIIKEHQDYHKDMLEYLRNLVKNGPTEFEPKKPTSKLPIPLIKKPRLIGGELHKYLVENLLSPTAAGQEPPLPKVETSESMNNYLKDCAIYEKIVDKHCVGFHARFGQVLEKVYGYWREEYAKGLIYKSWKEWLKEKFGIDDRNARKKREIAELINNFPRLQHLGISFTELYSRKKDIKAMLGAHPEYRQYWSK